MNIEDEMHFARLERRIVELEESLSGALSVLRTLELWRAGQPAEMDEEAYARVRALLSRC